MKVLIVLFITTLAVLGKTPSLDETLVLREDFRAVAAHIPIATEDLTNASFLSLSRLGEGAENYKLSFHPKIQNDPHYAWNGLTLSKSALVFKFAHLLDLSSEDSQLVLKTKNSGSSSLHIALKTPQGWFADKEGIGVSEGWKQSSLQLDKLKWVRLDIDTFSFHKSIVKPDFSQVEALAVVSPVVAQKSRNCTRLDWFSIHSSSAKIQPSYRLMSPFWRDSDSFLKSALVVESNGAKNRTRRGTLLRLGHGMFACFDQDLLRYSLIWRTPPGKSPLTMDSMAGVSYPDRKAKSSRAPKPVGDIMFSSPETSGVGSGTGQELLGDPRVVTSNTTGEKLGRMPRSLAQWQGTSIKNSQAYLHYKVTNTEIKETLRAINAESLERVIIVEPSKETVLLSIDPHQAVKISSEISNSYMVTNASLPFISVLDAPNVSVIVSKKSGVLLQLKAYPKKRIVKILRSKKAVSTSSIESQRGPKIESLLSKPIQVASLHAKPSVPIKVRNLTVPHDNLEKRPIRLTSIAFFSSGDALISTLDGNIWRVKNIGEDVAQWRLVASGLFEPMSIAITDKNQVYVLGRDQVTELIDEDGNELYDLFRCASDAFTQTLHTRDFSTSLIVDKQGNFIISKGGIRPQSGKNTDECSTHRGAVLRLPKDGGEAKLLADGLRIPFIGMDDNGVVFASDQQGHFTPSTPIYKLDSTVPAFGYDPTNHRKIKRSQPFLYIPHQSNRSASGFVTLPPRTFPDFAGAFCNLSWNGRLFVLGGVDRQSAFSVRLPVQLDYPVLNAAVHPLNGKLYGVGLGISGYKPDTKRVIGLCELEQSAPIPHPDKVKVAKNTITLTFSKPLPEQIEILANQTEITAWNIKRTPKYGSGHYLWSDKPGEHSIQYKLVLSRDRKKIVFSTSDIYHSSLLKIVMQIKFQHSIYPLEIATNPIHLQRANAEELAKLELSTPKLNLKKGVAQRGVKHFKTYACSSCHSLTDEKLNGPPLKAIFSRHNEAYIRESILSPEKVIAPGYAAGMPSFKGVIKPQELEDLIAYLKTLK